MPLSQLIYTSTAVENISDKELARILESARRHNNEHQITGMLLYNHGTFLQLLEGRQAAVDETYRRICRDSRHRDLMIVEYVGVPQRSFGSWAMAIGFHRGGAGDRVLLNSSDIALPRQFNSLELVRDPSATKAFLYNFALKTGQTPENWTVG